MKTSIGPGTIKRVHINQHNIKFNGTYGGGPNGMPMKPVISVKTGSGKNFKGNSVEIFGSCKVIYSPDKPLSCGAKVWIETTGGVEITNEHI